MRVISTARQEFTEHSMNRLGLAPNNIHLDKDPDREFVPFPIRHIIRDEANPTPLPQQKPHKPVVTPKPAPAVDIQSVVDAFAGNTITPITSEITKFLKEAKSLQVLTSMENVTRLNGLLRNLVTLKTYYHHKSKKSSSNFNKQLELQKVKAIDLAIKKISTSYEGIIKAMGANIQTEQATFEPSTVTNVSGIPLNWSGARLKATYVVFTTNALPSKPPVTNPSITTSSPNNGDQGTTVDPSAKKDNSLLWWIVGGVGGYFLIKKLG